MYAPYVALLHQCAFAFHSGDKSYLPAPYGPCHLHLAADAADESLVGQGVHDAGCAEDADAVHHADTGIERLLGEFFTIFHAYSHVDAGISYQTDFIAYHPARGGVYGGFANGDAQTGQCDRAHAFSLKESYFLCILLAVFSIAVSVLSYRHFRCNPASFRHVRVVVHVLRCHGDALLDVFDGDGEQLTIGQSEAYLLGIIVPKQGEQGGLRSSRGTGTGGESRLEVEEVGHDSLYSPSESVFASDVGPVGRQFGVSDYEHLESQFHCRLHFSLEAAGRSAFLGQDSVAAAPFHHGSLLLLCGEGMGGRIKNKVVGRKAAVFGVTDAFLAVENAEEGLVALPIGFQLTDGVRSAQSEEGTDTGLFHLAYCLVVVGAILYATDMFGEVPLETNHGQSDVLDGGVEVLGKRMGGIDDAADGVAPAEVAHLIRQHCPREAHAIVHLNILQITLRGVIEPLAGLFADIRCNASFGGSAKYQYHLLAFLKRWVK